MREFRAVLGFLRGKLTERELTVVLCRHSKQRADADMCDCLCGETYTAISSNLFDA